MTRSLVAVALLCGASGCATIFNGARDRVQIHSPSGVRRVREQGRELPVRINNDRSAYEVQLDPNTPHVLWIETGRATHTVATTRSVGAGWVVLDVLCHPLICVLVDAITGSWTGFDAIYLLDPPGPARIEQGRPASTGAPPSQPPPPPGQQETVLAPISVAPWERR
jgi:hypothetical protein